MARRPADLPLQQRAERARDRIAVRRDAAGLAALQAGRVGRDAARRRDVRRAA